jgi:cobyrinic acid a,c-diamide synthase
LELSERHLGLIPLDEKQLAGAFRKRLSRRIGEHIDMTRLVRIGQKADPLPRPRAVIFNRTSAGARVTIAIAKDEAFNFYYQDNLDILEYLGADIVTFSPIRDRKLPDGADGLYIGGGFPELFARDLARNKSLRRSIREGATRGMPVYAECGGLMYLVDSIIDFKGRKFPMAGIFRCSVRMGERLRRMGYVDIEVIKDNIIGKAGARNRAHLFHWSRLINIPKNTSFAYRIVKDKKDEFYDGLTRGSALASYAHLHFASDRTFAENFIDSCRKYKELNGDQAE